MYFLAAIILRRYKSRGGDATDQNDSFSPTWSCRKK